MGNRIPPKGTSEYRRYWANRERLRELSRTKASIAFAIATSSHNEAQQKKFIEAHKNIEAALNSFSEGHAMSYMEEVKDGNS